ncbi:MAG TPA: hypothetical protein VHU88_04545 [Sporichthyaceae bacterium]|nr:hypothetical protein [Sporichthyaceae bacterium]
MEAEVRAILAEHLGEPPVPDSGLGSRIHARFAAIGAEAPAPARPQMDPRAAVFDA